MGCRAHPASAAPGPARAPILQPESRRSVERSAVFPAHTLWKFQPAWRIYRPRGAGPRRGGREEPRMTRPRRFCARRGHDTQKFGRDAGHRCLECRREDAEARELAVAAAEAERDAERRRRREEIDRRLEQEYVAAIAAGGRVAAEARW